MIERMSYHDAISDPGSLADRRAQFEHEQQQRIEERKQQVALLSSPLSSADERIRLWERLHALDLPRSPTHKLLPIIAQQTAIALAQVLEVQQRRFAPVPSNSAV
jgi:hypothetical protein